jgi:hypothetical protein
MMKDLEKYQVQIATIIISVAVASFIILKVILMEINQGLLKLENGLGAVDLKLLEEVQILKTKFSMLSGESLKDHLALCTNLDIFGEQLDEDMKIDEDEEDGIASGGWLARVAAGLIVIGSISFLVALRTHTDAVAAVLMKNPHPDGDTDVKWSAMLAYRVDYIFSTTPSAKAIALGCSTVLMLVVGCFSLFAVSSQSLPDVKLYFLKITCC